MEKGLNLTFSLLSTDFEAGQTIAPRPNHVISVWMSFRSLQILEDDPFADKLGMNPSQCPQP